jgi:acetyl esterase
VVTAELDPLRDEGELYAERLRAAGVDVTTRRYEGAGHGFVQHFSWLPDYQGVYAETAGFIHSRMGR